MSIGKLRGHLFTSKTQVEGAIEALLDIDREVGSLKAEHSRNRYLLERLSNIIFGKGHKPLQSFEDLVEPIEKAFTVPVTELERQLVEAQNEVQRLRNLEFSLRNELNKVEKENNCNKDLVASWRLSYDEIFKAFGALQDVLLGPDSITETYNDLLAPAKQLVKAANLARKAAGLIPEAPIKTLIGHLEAIETRHNFSSKQFGRRTYTPPEGHVLVEQKRYDELIRKEYNGENAIVHRDFYDKLVKDSKDLTVIKEKLGLT